MALEYNIKIYEKNLITRVKPDMLVETLKLDESLDNAVMSMPRLDRKKGFKRFSRVNIEIKEDDVIKRNVDYLIFGSKVELAQRGSPNLYNHTITLIEPTKWLEKFPIGSLTFTQPLNGVRYTFPDVLERLRVLAPMVRQDKIEQTRLFDYEYDLINSHSSLVVPQIFIDKANLREALFQVFKVIDAVPKMRFDNLLNKWIIYAEYFDDRLLEIDIEEGAIDYMNVSEGENFAQSLESFVENIIPEKDTTTVFEGSVSDYISFRSDEVLVGESNRKLILSNKIERIKGFYAYITDNAYTGIYKLDLTSYLYEKDIYDTLNFKGVSGKEYALYYRYKQNTIEGFTEAFNIWGTVTALENIITFVAMNQHTISINDNSIKSMTFQVEYVPFIDTLRLTQARKYQKDYELTNDLLDKYSAIIYNSQERLNNLYSLSKNIYGAIQRTGVETATISKKHYTLTRYNATTNKGGLYDNRDYTQDNYVISTTELVYYPNHIIARHEFSKHFNRISQFIMLDKEYRPYEISLTKGYLTLKRDILLPMGYISINKTGVIDYTNKLLNGFMRTFTDSISQRTFNIANIKQKSTLSFKEIGVIKPLMALAEKNTIKYKVDFQDTKLAGKEVREETDWLVIKKQVQKGVFYTDNEGFIKYLEIDLLRQQWIETETYDSVSFKEKADNLKMIADNMPNSIMYYLDYQVQVLYEGKIITAVKVASANSEGDLPSGLQGVYYYVNSGTLVGKLYYWTNDQMVLKGNTTHRNNEIKHTLPIYQIEKDGAEVLGLEMILPIIVDETVINNIIIGEALTKQNSLLIGKDRDLYFKGVNSRFYEYQDYVNPNVPRIKITNVYIDGNKIIVPSDVYDSYNNYAIIDEFGNPYVMVNQVGLDGTKTVIDTLYFNFLDEL